MTITIAIKAMITMFNAITIVFLSKTFFQSIFILAPVRLLLPLLLPFPNVFILFVYLPAHSSSI